MHQFPVCAMQNYPSFFIGYEHNKTAFIFMCLSRYPEAKTNFSLTKALLIKPCGGPFFLNGIYDLGWFGQFRVYELFVTFISILKKNTKL